MPVQVTVPALVLGSDAVKRVGHVSPDIAVPVLIQGERGRSVLQEEVQDARFVGLQLRESIFNVICDQVGSARGGRKGNRLLGPAHRGQGCGRFDGGGRDVGNADGGDSGRSWRGWRAGREDAEEDGER